jgi:hypothetical protein
VTSPTLPTLLDWYSLSPVNNGVVPLIFAPDTSQIELSDAERTSMTLLATKLLDSQYQIELSLSGMYYAGTNIVPSLGISVPPELEPLRATLGWCAAGVDARSERLQVLGFRMPGQTSISDDLQQVWQANNFDAESRLVHDTAMIYGRSFVEVGVNDDGSPLLTTESPHNMLGAWDIRKRQLSVAYRTYYDVDPMSPTYMKQRSTLYTPESTIQLYHDSKGWKVEDRNDHKQGFVPVRVFSHMPTIKSRFGVSAMANSWRNCQDRACRTLVRSEIASEFFATMKIFLLGVTEENFRDGEGNLKSAWETYTGRLSALEADANGNLPQIHEVRGESPDGFISTIDQQAKIMAGLTGLPPQFLGLFSDGNPASADAIRMSDFRLKTTADRLCNSFGNEWEAVMRMTYAVQGDKIPEGSERLETDWAYTGIPTPSADAVTVTTQIAAGMIPPTADDALAACGWSPVQRQRFEDERKRTQGTQVLAAQLGQLQQPPKQAVDGQQPKALDNLTAKRSTDAATAG